uniref:Uncharacterized protein n=1 Tax=Arundo donax TaxID=35708 RepID=A0A0A9AI03_ARUDO
MASPHIFLIYRNFRSCKSSAEVKNLSLNNC